MRRMTLMIVAVLFAACIASHALAEESPKVPVQITDFPIILNTIPFHEVILDPFAANSESSPRSFLYPFIVYQGITYFPTTWRFAVNNHYYALNMD